MKRRASRGKILGLARWLRGLGWSLFMVVAVWSATSRLVEPIASKITASLASTLNVCDADKQGADCDPWETDPADEVADSDQGTEEIPTVADHQLWIAVFATSELAIAYSGKARRGFSSPEPRPAEQV